MVVPQNCDFTRCKGENEDRSSGLILVAGTIYSDKPRPYLTRRQHTPIICKEGSQLFDSTHPMAVGFEI